MIKFRKYTIIYFILFYFISFVYSNVENVADVYGLYSAVKDEFKHLSPFHGFIFIENEIARNYHEFNDSKDLMTKLVYSLFSRHGEAFRASDDPKSLANYINASVVGDIIVAIEKSKGSKEANDLLKIALNNNITNLEGDKKSKLVDDFVKKITDGLSISGHFSEENQIYPGYIVHHMILAFLYLKISKKSDLIQYFDKLKELNGGQEILTSDIWSKSYQPMQHIEILKSFRNQEQGGSALWNYAINNYEALAFAFIIAQRYGGKYPKYVMFAKALPSWFIRNSSTLIERQKYSYPDCMETAIRDLLNLAIYDQNKLEFNLNQLPFIVESQAPIAQFYKNFTLVQATSESARDIWSDVVSDIAGVYYGKRAKKEGDQIIVQDNLNVMRPELSDGWYYYEIKSSLENITKVVNHLFKLNLKNFGEFINKFNFTCGDIAGPQVECRIDVNQERNCMLKINPGKHGEISGFVTEEMTFPSLYKIMSDNLIEEKYENLEKMINVAGFGLDSFEIANKEDIKTKILNGAYLRHILMVQVSGKKDSVSSFILKNIANAPGADWYNKLFRLLINDIIKREPLDIPDIFVELAEYAQGQDNIKWAKVIITQNLSGVINYFAITRFLENLIERSNVWSIRWIKDLLAQEFTKITPLVKKEVIIRLNQNLGVAEETVLKKALNEKWYQNFFEKELLASLDQLTPKERYNTLHQMLSEKRLTKIWRSDFIKDMISKYSKGFDLQESVNLLIGMLNQDVINPSYWTESAQALISGIIFGLIKNSQLIKSLPLDTKYTLLLHITKNANDENIVDARKAISENIADLSSSAKANIIRALLLDLEDAKLWGASFIKSLIVKYLIDLTLEDKVNLLISMLNVYEYLPNYWDDDTKALIFGNLFALIKTPSLIKNISDNNKSWLLYHAIRNAEKQDVDSVKEVISQNWPNLANMQKSKLIKLLNQNTVLWGEDWINNLSAKTGQVSKSKEHADIETLD